MKYYITFIIAFLSISLLPAQIVTIPDANFKEALINSNCIDSDGNGSFDTDADINDDGEIQVSEAGNITSLKVNFQNITSLDGLESFISLTKLICNNNTISIIPLEALTNLEELTCSNNQISTLNFNNNPQLKKIYCENNNLEQLGLNNNTLLELLECKNNLLQQLDLSANNALDILDCSNNNLANINLNNNDNLRILNCNYNSLNTIDISNCVNLERIECIVNSVSNLNLSNNSNLIRVVCGNNNITDLNTSSNPLLEVLQCSFNGITTLDLNNNPNLFQLIASGNMIPEIDLSNNPYVNYLDLDDSGLETLILKNGFDTSFSWLDLENNPNLYYICVDNGDSEFQQVSTELENSGYTDVALNSYCTFNPGGEFFEIQGTVTIDLDNNGCDIMDTEYPYLMLNITNNESIGVVYGGGNGNYLIPVQEGEHTLTPSLENLDYFSISPENFTVNFPSASTPFTQDFCIIPNGIHNDLEIVVIPLEQARPGFDTDYKIIYKNKGNTILNGTIDFNYNDDFMDLIVSNPMPNTQSSSSLTWDYLNLLPFETEVIFLTMNLNSPTDFNFPLNSGDVLDFEATINPTLIDELPNDNLFIFNQPVVNSYDPNDKTCLEGITLPLEKIGDYVHYLIRFENTGSASAINVIVRDFIDISKFDLSTLIPLDSSHDFVTRISGFNKVEFIFENINLPFNDINNDGFIMFKVKTFNTLQVGNSFSNDAEIYFDYNLPIVTNDFVTTVEENLSVNDLELSSSIRLYPNPVLDILKLTSKVNIKSISIYDIKGSLLLSTNFLGNNNERIINLSTLSKGSYFIKLISDSMVEVQKLIKK